VKIDHIAVVVTDLEQAKAFYEKLGFTVGGQFDVQERYPDEEAPHHYRAVILRDEAPDRPVLWLMEPAGQAGPLRRFLARRGPGLHHLGLLTSDIKAETRKLQEQGIHFLRPAHDFPDDGEIRALIHPHDGQGLLIELLQRTRGGVFQQQTGSLE
jgi:methylmalonyl-CoA/ethylmalonyl-CoA epimerase